MRVPGHVGEPGQGDGVQLILPNLTITLVILTLPLTLSLTPPYPHLRILRVQHFLHGDVLGRFRELCRLGRGRGEDGVPRVWDEDGELYP